VFVSSDTGVAVSNFTPTPRQSHTQVPLVNVTERAGGMDIADDGSGNKLLLVAEMGTNAGVDIASSTPAIRRARSGCSTSGRRTWSRACPPARPGVRRARST